MFDYQNATIDQMVEHVKKSSSALVSRMRQYHKNKGNKNVVKMIDMARERVKLERVQQRMDELQND